MLALTAMKLTEESTMLAETLKRLALTSMKLTEESEIADDEFEVVFNPHPYLVMLLKMNCI